MTKNVFTISPTLCFSDTLAAELMKTNSPEEIRGCICFRQNLVSKTSSCDTFGEVLL